MNIDKRSNKPGNHRCFDRSITKASWSPDTIEKAVKFIKDRFSICKSAKVSNSPFSKTSQARSLREKTFQQDLLYGKMFEIY